MDELGQLILGERPASREADRSNVIAPKKSAMSGRNPELQPQPDMPDELGALILGGSPAQESKQTQTEQTSKGMLPTALQNLFEAKKQAPAFAASAMDVVAGLPSAVAGTVGYGAGRLFGLSPEEATGASQKVAGQLAEPVGRLTGTAGTKQYEQALPTQAMKKFGEVVQSNVVEPIAKTTGADVTDVGQGVNAAMMALPFAAKPLAKGYAAAKAELPTVRIETVKPSGMQSGGAAAASNEALLTEAVNRASPTLAAELKNLDPKTLNPDVLENYLKADQFGIQLTKGQATGDPNLISIERNERGLKPQLAEEYAKQNRALAENADLLRKKAGEGTNEINYVGNAERSIEYYKDINKESKTGIKQAYEEIDKLGAGKIKIDSKTLGENAMKALTEKEDIDFLPEKMKSKVEEFVNGKEINFDQLDNLITQISRETRKAQRAEDGNAVHALTILRGEVEKLPLLGETAAVKVVADKARSLAAKEFGLLDKRKDTYNAVYADIVNGAADSKDFIPKTIFTSKNAPFKKALDLIADKPEAVQQLKAGTLDYMIRKSTDASGNFNTSKFREFVDNLDVNGKGAPLFSDDWQSIKDLAKTGQLIEAQPKGSFVSNANTTPAAAQLAKQYGTKLATKIPIVGSLVEPALQIRAEQQMAREVKETMRPGAGAGTKLKNVGKE